MTYTFINLSKPDVTLEKRSHWKLKLWLLGIFAVFALCVLRWGGYLLLAGDLVPNQVDAAVVLQGPIASEKARIAAAMTLLQRGSAERVALSVPRESYWDEEIPAVARQYLAKTYGTELAGRVDFCQTAADLTSTEQEEQAVSACIQEHQWKTVVLVTSSYDSRRVGMIWKKTQGDPSIRVAVEGVADPEYQPRGWWRRRLYAETWFMESTKLVWAVL